MSPKKSKLTVAADILLIAVLIAADRLTKNLAAGSLKGGDITLIEGVLKLHYLENRGAAFSMLQNQKWVFVAATVIMLAASGFVLKKVPAGKKYLMWHICLTLIAAGGVGNLIDRLRFSYVIDFIYFSLIDFPVFNVADICVTVGVAVLCFMLIFVWKEEDLKFLSFAKNKDGNVSENGDGDDGQG